MKNNTLIILILCLAFYSCKKDNIREIQLIAEDSGCIELKKVLPTDHSGYSINNSNIPIINMLFLSNGINNSKYRYHYFYEDSILTNGFISVRVTEFTNGVEIFPNEIVFVFTNNILSYRDGNETKGTNLNTIPNLSIKQIRTLFLGSIEQFDHKGNEYKDSCFWAEFGYFNTDAGTNNSTEHLIKSWRVTLKNSIYPSEYPIAYYQDDDGKLIVYDNGIITFK